MGKWRTHNLLEIYSCATVDPSTIRSRATVPDCFKFVPIEVKVPGIGWTKAFLDPLLNIITESSPPADCRTARFHIIETEDGVFRFDSQKNMIVKIPTVEIHSLPTSMGSEAPELKMEVFHDLILINETEIFEQIYQSQHVDELDRINHWKDETSIKAKSETTALSATPHTLPGIIESYYFGWMEIFHDVWLNICAGIVTIYALRAIFPVILPLGITGIMGIARPVGQIGTMAHRRWVDRRVRSPERHERSPRPRERRIINPAIVRFRTSRDSDAAASIELQQRIPLNRNVPERSSLVRRWTGLFASRGNPSINNSPDMDDTNAGDPE